LWEEKHLQKRKERRGGLPAKLVAGSDRSLDSDALVHNAFAMKTQSSTDKFQHLNLRKKRGVKDAASEQNHGAMGQVIVGGS
jgi:hypothetical protein